MTSLASGTRLSTWTDPEMVRDQSFYSMIHEINTGNVDTMPWIPEFTEFNGVFNEAVDQAVVERSAILAEALTEAADETTRLLSD